MTLTYVQCGDTTPLVGGNKYRVTFSQGSFEHWLAGGTLSSVYQSLGDPANFPWAFPVSEPPVDNAQAFTVDLQVRNTTVGAAPPGTVADLLHSLSDLSFYNAYDVVRIEKLAIDAPILTQRSIVTAQALTDAQQSGILGTLDKVGTGIGQTVGSAKTLLIGALIVIGLVALVLLVGQARAVRA